MSQERHDIDSADESEDELHTSEQSGKTSGNKGKNWRPEDFLLILEKLEDELWLKPSSDSPIWSDTGKDLRKEAKIVYKQWNKIIGHIIYARANMGREAPAVTDEESVKEVTYQFKALQVINI